ncbi:redox-sensitive transcriptional regulator HypR [Staphylococcus caprae]|uniref:redox-sensitive transcriptional regulator HypR n=1 Tax=Staphylococcus caprae TaxID=29380 RepID=UPI000E69341E|nr:redox-sensitive transcriptional regulator HypR [Staphylococcus caprae]MBU5271797.1 Rrf2 family transcriptional regulator [Staphylococcus caprae]RIM35704.1 transcriptional regulator [Staphylococcus caprae]
MNLEFNIAIHVLTFLTKHKDEKFNSKELAKLTCLNPVQLRRVVSVLSDQHYITTVRGKSGGYQSNQHTASVNLATLYQQFVLNKESHQRIYTGDISSHCDISKHIAHTMSDYYDEEIQLILNFYRNKTIQDVLNDILQEVNKS